MKQRQLATDVACRPSHSVLILCILHILPIAIFKMTLPSINRLSFNSTGDMFAVCTDDGVRLFNVDPLVELAEISKYFASRIR